MSVELTAFEVRIHEALGSNDYSDGVVLSGECQNDDGYLFFRVGGRVGERGDGSVERLFSSTAL